MIKLDIRKQAISFVDKIKAFTDWTAYSDETDEEYETHYCGTYMGIQPSGKYYTGWTTNQTVEEEDNDYIFWNIVGKLLPEYDFVSGDGDPCDCYVVRRKQ